MFNRLLPYNLFCTLVSACALVAASMQAGAEINRQTIHIDMLAGADSPDFFQQGVKVAAQHETGYIPLGSSQTHTVGPDVDCDFSSLQLAINAAGDDDIIRLMDDGGYSGQTYSINAKALTIRGGYPDCDLASTHGGRTLLDADGSGQPVISVQYDVPNSEPTRQVNLENLTVTGASGNAATGIEIDANPSRMQVNLRNVEIIENVSTNLFAGRGAGLRIIQAGDHTTTLAFVTVDNDSRILSNNSAGDGGGIYCRSNFAAGLLSPVLRIGDALISGNQSEGSGGGIAINGCENVLLLAGGPEVDGDQTSGVVGNLAADNGGGIYVVNGGEVFVAAGEVNGLGNSNHAAMIVNNSAGIGGGAVAVNGMGSSVILEDTLVFNNFAAGSGGAFRVITDAELTVRRSNNSGACEPAQFDGVTEFYPPCSVVAINTALKNGGAFSLSGGVNVDVSRTTIFANSAGSGFRGSVADVGNLTIDTGSPSRLTLKSALIVDNTGNTVLSAGSNGIIDVIYSTIAENGSRPFRASASSPRLSWIQITSSIVVRDDASALVQTAGDGDLQVSADCVIGSAPEAASGLTSAVFYSQIDPELSDDFRPGPRSPAIDYCSDANVSVPGLDGNPRGQAWTGPTPNPAPNSEPGGLFDLGAFEMPFSEPDADITSRISPSEQFVGSEQTSVMLQIEVTNNGPDSPTQSVTVSDMVPPEFISTQWSCSANASAVCGNANGAGDINESVDLSAGDSVIFTVTADLAAGLADGIFSYTATADTDMLTNDPVSSNNSDTAVFQIGLFADGFE